MTALKALHAELALARAHVAKLERAIACFEPPVAKDPDRPKRHYTKRAPKSKLCSRCGVTKPASEWWRNSNSSDGLQYACKACLGKQMEESKRQRKAQRAAAERVVAEPVVTMEPTQPTAVAS